MIPILNFPDKVQAADSDYPSGRPINNDGSGQATRVNRETLGDMWQLLSKIMRESGLTPNGLPDNEYSGNQLYEALMLVTRPYYSFVCQLVQSGAFLPSDSVIYSDIDGTITFGYTSTGVYSVTYTGSIANIFSIPYCALITPSVEGVAVIEYVANTTLRIRTFDATGAPANDILNGAGFRIDIQK